MPPSLNAEIKTLASATPLIMNPALKIVELDPLLIPLIEDTTPSFDDHHTPYNPMFINNQFSVAGFIINGIALAEHKYLSEMPSFWVDIDGVKCHNAEFDIYKSRSDIRLFAVAYDTLTDSQFYLNIDLGEGTEFPAVGCNPEETKRLGLLRELIDKIVANLLNLINNDHKDIELIEIEVSDEHNKKRIKRGKESQRDKLLIRLGGTLRLYAEHFQQHRNNISIHFLVRGHWREFKAPRYTQARGTKKWIYPFYKGADLPDEIKKFIYIRKENTK